MIFIYSVFPFFQQLFMPQKRHKTLLLLLIPLIIMGAGFAFSQTTNLDEKIPPYEQRLLRLSEIMGSMHFLTLLCNKDDGQLWYNNMQDMLKAEAPSKLRHARLIERFNFGFESFQATYRSCNAPAQVALDRYFQEAQTIVQNLTSDFSG